MTSETVLRNKKILWDFWQALNACQGRDVGEIVRAYVDEHAAWYGPHPLNHFLGAQAQLEGFWQPLFSSFANLQRRTDMFIGGHEHWIGAIGYFNGLVTRDWLGIPATGEAMHIRFGEFSAVHHGKVVLTYINLDILDVLRQAGYQLVPTSLGKEGLVPGPKTADGVFFTPREAAEGAKTLALAKTMCRALNTPACEPYWDSQNMMWYGPSGIGTAHGYKQFEDWHQNPFNHAFPTYSADRMGVHIAEVGEGNFAGWVGWPSIIAAHSGDYMGIQPSGKMIAWRLMDFYRREGDLIVENWVPIDMVYVYLQLGLDVFAELRRRIGN